MAVDLHTVGDSSSLSYPFLPPSHDLNHSNNINTKESPLSPHLHTSQSTNAQAQGKDKDDDDDDLVAELTRQMHMAHFMLQDDHKFDFSGIGSQNMESVLVCLLILPLCEKLFSSFFFKNLYTTVPFYTFSFFFCWLSLYLFLLLKPWDSMSWPQSTTLWSTLCSNQGSPEGSSPKEPSPPANSHDSGWEITYDVVGMFEKMKLDERGSSNPKYNPDCRIPRGSELETSPVGVSSYESLLQQQIRAIQVT